MLISPENQFLTPELLDDDEPPAGAEPPPPPLVQRSPSWSLRVFASTIVHVQLCRALGPLVMFKVTLLPDTVNVPYMGVSLFQLPLKLLPLKVTVAVVLP
jgi:hypothetical protein